MISRQAAPNLSRLADEFGVVSVTGPRQSGKTTLVRELFSNHAYHNLEDPSVLSAVRDDPKGFINAVRTGAIIDEVQKFPELLSYIQVAIDEDFRPGKFIITGSENLLLSEKISQSLAGRVGIFHLLPLTIQELQAAGALPDNHFQLMLQGFYPGLYDKHQTPSLYYANYLSTYVERDVRNIRQIGDLNAFTKFLQLLAGRVGQLLNLNDLAGVVGIDHKTAKAWLSVLEASFIVHTLEPHFQNFGKRLVKSPKVYFTDVGLAAHLLRINSVDALQVHFALGGLFENLIVTDLLKQKYNTLSTTNLYFVRDSKGLEIDLLLDRGSALLPIEIKAGETYRSEYLKPVEQYKSIAKLDQGALVYTGNTSWNVNGNAILNYRDLSQLEKQSAAVPATASH